jgi:hypothetical protein
MIRSASDADIPRIAEMGLRFHRESSYRDHLAENPEQIKLLAKKVVTDGICSVIESNGALCGVICLMLFHLRRDGGGISGMVG